MTSLTYFTVTADWVPASSVGSLSGIVTFQMLVTEGDGLVAPTLTTPGIVVPITTQGRITNGVLYGLDGNPGVSLLANTSVLNLSSTLYYTVSFTDVVYTYPTSSAATQAINLSAFTFAALTSAATVDLSDVAPAAGALAAQILSITSAEIADATALGRELLTAPDAATARADLAIPPLRRPRRNTIAAVGDSITALGSEGWYQPWLGHTWINQLQVMTHQRIRYGAGNFSVAGTPISNQQSVQLPQVLAMNPLPGACVLAVGTNDLQSSTYNFGVTVTALKAMVAALEFAGVAPILWCPPPNDFVGSVPVATIHARTYQWNAFIRRYAAANGYALVDAFTALAQADGTAIAGSEEGTLISGHIHPTGYGARLIAEQFLADGGADIFPPNSLVNTARTTDDLSNMLNNGTINQGLFTADANSDGVADGLSGSGTGTHSFSRVSPAPNDQLAGMWQQLSAGAGGTATIAITFATGWSIGDTIAFSGRIQTDGVDASGGCLWLVALKTDTPGGYETPDGSTSLTFLWNGIYEWDGDMDDGEFYVEFVIPSQATNLQLWLTVGGTLTSPVNMRLGEVTIRNLTTEGLLI